MTFISHAQNFEDVMLWRCFGQLKSGFYIDIGAYDPIIHSVTKSFYDNGWSGINIDPSENSFTKLQEARMRDINIQVAVDAQEGLIDFWNVPKTGLSTAVKRFADRHKSAGLEVVPLSVKTRTLKDICEEFVKSEINFMKIDVEGFEKQVLIGADFEKYRPMVILVESTEPNSQVQNYKEWENILLERDYAFCYADGLNRFYVSKEATELKLHFNFPPNVFDKFVLSTDWRIYHSDLSDLDNNQSIISRNLLLSAVNSSDHLTPQEKKRILMTASCKDSDSIPKVANAGKLLTSDNTAIQIMHNGIKIVEGCYYGPWMTHVIEILNGHHEPQEEIAFFQVMEQLRRNPSPWGSPRMIELGSFWAYYSMWFLKDFPEASAFCFEPDPNYLEIGRQNFELNDLNGKFINAMVSDQSSILHEFQCESDGQVISVPALNFTGVVSATEQKNIDIILVDIQGAEIPLLQNLSEVLEQSTIRFMAISTHDIEISGSPITHQSALELLIQNDAHIILEHSVSESFSGDGFILASFFEEDKSMHIPISYNRSKNSLFGEWEPRMYQLQEDLTQQRDQLTQQIQILVNSNIWKLTKPLRALMNFLRK